MVCSSIALGNGQISVNGSQNAAHALFRQGANYRSVRMFLLDPSFPLHFDIVGLCRRNRRYLSEHVKLHDLVI